MAVNMSNLNELYFFRRKIPWQICSKLVIKNPTAPCMCCYTTLRNISIRKQAINDKLQGSVATHLRFGGVVNNQNKKGSLLSLSMNIC